VRGHNNYDVGSDECLFRCWVRQMYTATVNQSLPPTVRHCNCHWCNHFSTCNPGNFRGTASRRRVERGAQRSIESGEAESQMHRDAAVLIGSSAHQGSNAFPLSARPPWPYASTFEMGPWAVLDRS
jgi:hypothetical protein